MKLLTSLQMREVDNLTTSRFNISQMQLMETAGVAAAEFIESVVRPTVERRIVVLCGKGNNGGDGFVVARHLAQHGGRPTVILCADPTEVRGESENNLKRFLEGGNKIEAVRSVDQWRQVVHHLAAADVVVDALVGTGLRGAVSEPVATVVRDINEHHKRHRFLVFSIDIPSGLSADNGDVPGEAIEADFTVTFTAPKVGMLLAPASTHVGRLKVVSIGSPRELVEECAEGHVRWLEPGEFSGISFYRPADSNKGQYGHALLVAGSLGKTGAAVMAGTAALRSGAGLVTAAVPEPCLPIVAAHTPEMMTEALVATEAGSVSLRSLEYEHFNELIRGKTVLAMGPGLGTHNATQEFVRTVVQKFDLPMILDADALNAFAGNPRALRNHKSKHLVLTPHPGEMARLIGSTAADVQAHRIDVARKAAADFQATVVLKGNQTVIAAPDSKADGKVWINPTGNPGMAKGGTGDVLTGMLTGILAERGADNAFETGAENWNRWICAAVYLHGLAGDIASIDFGETSLMATDLINAIPKSLRQFKSQIDFLQFASRP